MQIIFAGKAHQDDQQSKQLLQQVFNAAKDQAFGGRIAFVEDYDELLAQYLVHGVDVWVNNPLPPMEAERNERHEGYSERGAAAFHPGRMVDGGLQRQERLGLYGAEAQIGTARDAQDAAGHLRSP